MSSPKKIIIIAVSAILLAVLLFFAFNFYRQLKEPVSQAIKAIPLNASVIIEIKNSREIWEKLSSDNDIWKDLEKIKEVKKFNIKLNQIDSLISNNQRISDILKEQNLIISVHTSLNYSTNALFIIGASNTRESLYINDFIRDNGSEIISREFKGTEIYRLNAGPERTPLYYYVHKGIIACSFSEKLVEESLIQLNSKSIITNDKNLQKLRNTSGKKVDANIYINYENANRTFAGLVDKNTQEYIKYIGYLAEWTEIDLLLKNDELLLNGFTAANSNEQNFLKLFSLQTPQSISATGFMPYNTIYFINYGYDDFPLFYESYKSYLSANGLLESYEQKISTINNKINNSVEKSFLSWIGNEMSLLITDPVNEDIYKNTFLIINATNIDTAKSELEKLIKITGEKEMFTKKHKDFVINKIEIPGLLPALFGKQFKGLESNYYTIFDNYVIFANDPSSLIKYLNTLKVNRSLAKNENYIEFSDNITEKSNIYMYCNLRKSINVIKPETSGQISDLINNNSAVFENFEAFSVQFSSNSDLFYTNIYLKHNPFYKEEKSSQWEVNLDAEIRGQPFVITDHNDNSKKIIAFDINNNMYMIDFSGSVLWKRKLEGNIIGDLYLVDYYGNGKIQYLFNTENNIYLIDLNGEKVANYPVPLPANATNGIALFVYNNKKDYRILVACENNRVYNYNIKGEQVSGWQIPKTSGKITTKLKHIVSAGKDYIIIAEEDGSIIITDRRGKTRIKNGRNAANSIRSDIYLNETNSRGIFLTTNNKGELIYIASRSGIKKTVFENFSEAHYFLYEDFNNDGNNDFIFLDKNKLIIYDRFKNVLLSHTFTNEIKIKPKFIKLDKKVSILGVVDSVDNKIHLFNSNGIIQPGIDLRGETDFVIEEDPDSGALFLITGSGDTLYKYEIIN